MGFRDLSVHPRGVDRRRLGLPQAFRRELKIVEAEREYWVPVQEVLASSMKTELRPSEEIELFMIYIGQVDGRHIFLVNEFGHESPH